MKNPFIPVAGVTETLLPALRHVLARVARARRGRQVPLATRPEEIPTCVMSNLLPRDRRLARYLELTDGLDLSRGDAAVLPPLYPTAWGLIPFLRVLSEPRLDVSLMGVIHAQNDLISHRPIRATDVLTLALSLERLHRDDQRALMTLRCDCIVGGEVAAEVRTMLIAGLSPAGAARESMKIHASMEGWSTIHRVSLGRHHPLRYALLSGDINPVHLLSVTSRPFGFPQPILHGFCLKSIIIHALVRSAGGGDLSSIRRLRLRFRSPVCPPTTLEIQVQGSKV